MVYVSPLGLCLALLLIGGSQLSGTGRHCIRKGGHHHTSILDYISAYNMLMLRHHFVIVALASV